jgi:hypothetical protein
MGEGWFSWLILVLPFADIAKDFKEIYKFIKGTSS